jgi:type II secretory pathway component PulC
MKTANKFPIHRTGKIAVSLFIAISYYFAIWPASLFSETAQATGKKGGDSLKVQASDSTKKSPSVNEKKASPRDPFLPWGEVPGKGPQAPPLQLKLKGILWSAKKPLAIMEDAAGVSYIITESQDIGDGRTILAIKKDRVIIKERSGKTLEIKLLEEATTSPPSPGK